MDDKVLLHELLHLKHWDVLQGVFWCVLRALRTVRTILVTFFAMPLLWEDYAGLALLVLLVHVVVAIWICRVLFSLRRSLLRAEEDGTAEVVS